MASGEPSPSSVRTRQSSSMLPIAGPTVTNIVCGMKLNCRFDLQTIARHGRNVEYKPRKFPAAVMRIYEPKATALVFESGSMQVLGTRSVDDAKLASRKFARMLQKIGFKPRIEGFRVQNMVASVKTNMRIRLEGIESAHWEYANYEPEIFPGLTYLIMKPKVTALVFASGKIVLLGAKTKEDLDEAMAKLYPVLVQYRFREA